MSIPLTKAVFAALPVVLYYRFCRLESGRSPVCVGEDDVGTIDAPHSELGLTQSLFESLVQAHRSRHLSALAKPRPPGEVENYNIAPNGPAL